MRKISGNQINQLLQEFLEENSQEIEERIFQDFDLGEDDQFDLKIKDFSDSGLMTRDDGFILKIGNQEFQITIIKSK